jgi:hypothetical protein
MIMKKASKAITLQTCSVWIIYDDLHILDYWNCIIYLLDCSCKRLMEFCISTQIFFFSLYTQQKQTECNYCKQLKTNDRPINSIGWLSCIRNEFSDTIQCREFLGKLSNKQLLEVSAPYVYCLIIQSNSSIKVFVFLGAPRLTSSTNRERKNNHVNVNKKYNNLVISFK